MAVWFSPRIASRHRTNCLPALLSLALLTYCAAALPSKYPLVPSQSGRVRPQLLWAAKDATLIDYWWVSNDRMYLKLSRESKSGEKRVTLEQLDVRSLKVVPCDDGLSKYDMSTAVPSPDGSRFIIYTRPDVAHAYWIVLDSTGRLIDKQADALVSRPLDVFWSSGGSTWSQYTIGGPEELVIVVFTVNDSRTGTSEPIPSKRYLLPYGRIPVGYTDPLHLMFENLTSTSGRPIEVYRLGERLRLVRSLRLKPALSSADEVIVETGGDQVCWWDIVNGSSRNPTVGRLTAKLYVADAYDGTGALVASFDIDAPDATSADSISASQSGGGSTHTRWSPNGAFITYMRKNQIWEVHVP